MPLCLAREITALTTPYTGACAAQPALGLQRQDGVLLHPAAPVKTPAPNAQIEAGTGGG
jgi:hypothetical protein